MRPPRRRTALLLYCLLLVLPTVVLATLHWYQLRLDARETLEAVPAEARRAAARLGEALRGRLDALMDAEGRRPFFHYRPVHSPPAAAGADTDFLPSPFSVEPAPEGVLCRFSYDFDEGADAPLHFFDGGDDESGDLARTRQVAREFVAREWRASYLRRSSPRADLRREEYPLPFVALNRGPEPLGCSPTELDALRALRERTVGVRTFGFHLQLWRQTDGTPWVIATRQVRIEPVAEDVGLPSCLEPLTRGATLVDGFFLDPRWLFEELPARLAGQVLGRSQVLLPPDSPAVNTGGDLEVVRLRPVEELQIETVDEADRHWSSLQLVVDTAGLRDHFHGQRLRFFGVAAMLFCSLATGLWLLLASVRRDLEHARRTENFVSAVTHELRTPVAAIRLYAEMLRDGWVASEDQRSEYYERIVGEALRLETTVERVLLKGRLAPGRTTTRVGDLSEEVGRLLAEEEARGANDLAADLASDLPPVRIDGEALHSIVANLIENARKYAPVPPDAPDADKLRVATGLVDGRPALLVSDRGPGIPDAEKPRVLRAFYRIGNEATRSTRGTGLGLHLVDLQARALGGSVEILDREGGGTTFRVLFRPADEDPSATE